VPSGDGPCVPNHNKERKRMTKTIKGPNIDLTYNTSETYNGPLIGIGEQHRLKEGFNHTFSASYSCDKRSIVDHVDMATYSDVGDGNIRYIIFENNTLIEVYWSRGMISLAVHGKTPKEALARLDEVKKLFPESKIEQVDQIQMSFWTSSSMGATRMNRKLIVPDWSEIKGNYNEQTGVHLSRLMEPDYRPGVGGKLLLWQGEPGTGKTTALRALSRSWKDWAALNYITDPEKFFGSDANYMYQVITSEGSHWDQFDDDGNKNADERWNLLILEDCGELLAADARTHAGQGLSRFLNCVDGLIGQGLNLIVLVTTNEELGKLHPAVQRPGRTAARIEFKSLEKKQASEWLGSPVDKAMTIAELYAKKEGFDNKGDEKGLVGFAN
jgi:hypothetical protein